MEFNDELVGQKIKSKYLVERFIGKGGMGRVYLVKHLKLGNRWAMKIVKRDKTIEKSLKQEATILEKMNHPNIPHIIDMFTDKENIYMVETYAQGNTLADKIKLEGKIDEREAIDYFMQLSELLEYLHSMKPHPIIYRDLKPNNVVVTHNNKLMLVDFGISKFEEDNSLETIIAGNKFYSPPEQLDFNMHADVRADIYSLGMLVLRMITGENTKEVIRDINDITYISNDLKEILEKCTYKDPECRYQEVSELITDLKYLKDMSNTCTSGGRKIIYVDGAKNSGKTFVTSQVAYMLAKNKISTAIVDLTYDVGVSEYMNIEQDENISDVLMEKNLEKIKRKSYKVGKYINVYKGEILQESDLIEFVNRLTKIAKVVIIDGDKNRIDKIGTYVNDIVLVSGQEEKMINTNNKRIIEYLDNNVHIDNVLIVVNKYENTDISKYEMLKNINLIPRLFKRRETFRSIMSIKNVDRELYLKNVKKKLPLYECDKNVKEDIEKIVNELYQLNFVDTKRTKFLKVGSLW